MEREKDRKRKALFGFEGTEEAKYLVQVWKRKIYNEIMIKVLLGKVLFLCVTVQPTIAVTYKEDGNKKKVNYANFHRDCFFCVTFVHLYCSI